MLAIRQTVKYCAAKETFAGVGQIKVRNWYFYISNTMVYFICNHDGVSRALTKLD